MRRSILDNQKRSEICGVLAMGATRAVAARFAGCSVSTLYRAARNDPKFAAQLKQAEGRAEVLQLDCIGEVVRRKREWRASAWLLERRYPNRYTLRKPKTATMAQVAQLLQSFAEMIVAEIPDPQLRQRIIDRMEQIAREFNAPANGEGAA